MVLVIDYLSGVRQTTVESDVVVCM